VGGGGGTARFPFQSGPCILRNAASALPVVPLPIPVPEGEGNCGWFPQFGAVRVIQVDDDLIECSCLPCGHQHSEGTKTIPTQNAERKTQNATDGNGTDM